MFFTSYANLNLFFDLLASKNDGKNRIFREHSDSVISAQAFKDYQTFVNRHRKGVMLCVARGRLNEGINLADHMARACFVVGIPYLPLGDSKVILRKNYADSTK